VKQALFILNPYARRAPAPERLRAAIDALPGWEAALALTEAAGHATELARDAARRGFDIAVACGGDGTVNEVANGLAASETALAVVPCGTANVWAKEVRIPKKLERAVAVVAGGETRTIDLGRAGDRYFLCVAGAGFDAAMVSEVGGAFKRRLGAAAYVLHGLRRSLRYRERDAVLRTGAAALDGSLYWLIIGNTRSYGGVLHITDRARSGDGRLDLFLVRRGGLHRLLWIGLMVLLRRHHRQPNAVSAVFEQLRIETPGFPVQVDGEFIGETPLTFEVAPAALRVIVPRGLRSPLFGSATPD
jgi:YegS/Rv2252/BmrU family lipid kinase